MKKRGRARGKGAKAGTGSDREENKDDVEAGNWRQERKLDANVGDKCFIQRRLCTYRLMLTMIVVVMIVAEVVVKAEVMLIVVVVVIIMKNLAKTNVELQNNNHEIQNRNMRTWKDYKRIEIYTSVNKKINIKKEARKLTSSAKIHKRQLQTGG